MIMEVDGQTVADPLLGFKSPISTIAFAFKDPDEVKDGGADPEGVTPEKLEAIKTRISELETKLYSAARTGPDGWAKYLDLGSAIDFHLVKEFTKDTDTDFYRSHYFWWDPVAGDDKFHFGPAWDFDRSAGNQTDGGARFNYVSSPEGWYMRGTGVTSGRSTYTTHWFVQLFKDPVFEAAVKARWADVKAEFARVGNQDIADHKAAIGVAAANDRARWASEPKRFNSRGSFDQEIAFVTKWYKDRYTWMDGQLTN